MKVNPDPKKQRCEGILSATGAAGAEVGKQVKKCEFILLLGLNRDLNI